MSSSRNAPSLLKAIAQFLVPEKTFKVLITGNPKCGKSTFIRKLRLRLGDSISNEEKQDLKNVIYAEFAQILSLNADKLQCRIPSLRSIQEKIPYFWSELAEKRPDDWSEKTRGTLQAISKEPFLWQLMDEQHPGHSFLKSLRFTAADIFQEGWLPQDADVIQCYVASTEIQNTSLSPRISFLEANAQSLGKENASIVEEDLDLVVFLVGIRVPEFNIRKHSDTLDQFRKLHMHQKTRGKFAHLIYNDFARLHRVYAADAETPVNPDLEAHVRETCDEPNAIAGTLCALDSSWMEDVLKSWEEISPQKLLSEHSLLN